MSPASPTLLHGLPALLRPIVVPPHLQIPETSEDEMRDISERKLNRYEAADFLCRLGYPIARATLSKYATVGGGPEYEKFGRRPLYTEHGLLDWVRRRTTAVQRSSSILIER